MNCIVIEDDKVQQLILCEFIKNTEGINLLEKFDSAIEAIDYIQNPEIDLIFLDVEMPKMTGIEFIEQVKPKANVILVTSNKDYAIDAFNNDVVDYLVKPYTYQRFLHSLSKIKKTESLVKDFIIVKANGAMVKINFDELLWIQSANEYLVLYTTRGKHMVYSSMKKMIKGLSGDFIQVHRSNIVNLQKIESLKSSKIRIGDFHIKVSRTYLTTLKKKINDYKNQKNNI